MAYQAWSVVFGEQPTASKWNILGTNDAAFNSGGGVQRTGLASGVLRLGSNVNTGATLTNAYVTYASVTATSTGGVCVADVEILAGNANSGIYLTMSFKVLCDGVALTPSSETVNLPYINGATPLYTYGFKFESTPSAGSHTWALQILCSSNSAATLADNRLSVREVI